MSQLSVRPIPGSGGFGTVMSVSGGNNITITGTATVNPIVNVSGTTNHAVQVGNATNSLTSVAVGTTGQVLTGVTGGSPTFQSPAASSISITGNTGGALTGAAFTFSGGTTGLSFGGSVSTETLTFAGITANGGVVNLGTDNAANAINIGLGNVARNIDIGFSAANHLIRIGAATGALAVDIESGSGNVIVNSVGGTAQLSGSNGVTVSTAGGNAVLSSASGNSTTIDCGTGGCNVGTTANAHATIVGSTTAASTTTIQAPSAGVILTGVQGVVVANKNYVTINTATGAIGSDAGAASSISITGDTGGALTGAAFTLTGGTSGLTFAGAGSTETLGGTLAIANGGTNATSMATTDGVVYYDGTSLVTTSAGTATQVLTSNGAGVAPTYQAVSGGPGNNIFLAYLSTSVPNVTGNTVIYQVVFDSVQSNPGAYYNTGTGAFTAPATGNYLFNTNINTSWGAGGYTRAIMYIQTTAFQYKMIDMLPVNDPTTGANEFQGTCMARMTAGDTAYVGIWFFGGLQDVGIAGSSGGGQLITWFSGYYVSA